MSHIHIIKSATQQSIQQKRNHIMNKTQESDYCYCHLEMCQKCDTLQIRPSHPKLGW